MRRLSRKSRVIDEISCHRNTCLVNVESNHYRFVNALLRSVIGPENSHHSFNQSDSKLKPITTWSPAFSRVSGCLVIFLLGLVVWLWKVEAVVKTIAIEYCTIETSFALGDISFQLSDIHYCYVSCFLLQISRNVSIFFRLFCESGGFLYYPLRQKLAHG